MALTWQLFCIEIANGIGIGAGTGKGTGVAPGHECRRSYLRDLLSMPFAFSTLLIRQLTDLLQIENKSANSSSTRAIQAEREREWEREGERVSEFGNSFCMLRPERCNKNQARDEFAQSAGNYLHVYTEIETQQTQRTHAGTHTTHSTHIPVLMSRWRTQ